MDVFLQKMRIKKNRKVLVIEEAWKAIASPLMAEYIKFMYKTARKFWASVGVVTQEIQDIIGSEIVKEAIINNSDVVMLLDQSKFKERFDSIKAILGLTDVDCKKIFTINRLENKEGRSFFREVFIRRGSTSGVYGGSYLMKVCDDTKSLCMQFESIVTNSTLTFSDVAFLEIKEEFASLLRLSELGNIDWQRMLDDLARIPGNFTKENLQSDLDNLYNMGVGLATAGIGNIGDALLQTSSFHDLMNGKVEEIFHLYDHYSHLYEAAEQDAGRLLLDMVGGPENVAGLFNFSSYDLTSWITDYMDEIRWT